MRDRFIKSWGEDKFLQECKNSERLNRYKDLPIPERYLWIWGHFIAIWQQSEIDFNGNRIFSYGTINDYVECMKVPLSISDKRMILKMKTWALQALYDLDESSNSTD